MFTRGSMIYNATREQVIFVAECANLRHEMTSVRTESWSNDAKDYAKHFPSYSGRKYDMWQDYQTGGGGCRMVWTSGVVWISRHSGYAWADITDEVAEVFEELGCKETSVGWHDNPHMY